MKHSAEDVAVGRAAGEQVPQNAAQPAIYARHGYVAAESTDSSGNEEREPDVRFVWRPGQPV